MLGIMIADWPIRRSIYMLLPRDTPDFRRYVMGCAKILFYLFANVNQLNVVIVADHECFSKVYS